jgi:hypothetical protein
MKTILYLFGIGWFLTGLLALLAGQQFWMQTAQPVLPPVSGTAATVGIAWQWIWTFPMPALLAGALAAVLGRLDDIREAIDFSNEPDEVEITQSEAGERVAPYIGENYLKARPEGDPSSSKKDNTDF